MLNREDIREWKELCTYLDGLKRKSSYHSLDIPNVHLLEKEKAFAEMRSWMRENGLELVFYADGWGWRLRKNWKEKIKRMEELTKSTFTIPSEL